MQFFLKVTAENDATDGTRTGTKIHLERWKSNGGDGCGDESAGELDARTASATD